MTLTLDCDFGSRFDELGEEGIFWICDSLVNRQAAEFLKAKLSEVHILPPDAVTTCEKKSGQDLDICFASIVHTISEHHNGFSNGPHLTGKCLAHSTDFRASRQIRSSSYSLAWKKLDIDSAIGTVGFREFLHLFSLCTGASWGKDEKFLYLVQLTHWLIDSSTHRLIDLFCTSKSWDHGWGNEGRLLYSFWVQRRWRLCGILRRIFWMGKASSLRRDCDGHWWLSMVIDGETTLVFLESNEETKNVMMKGDLIVVPQNTWHRFESPKGVKIMTVTPEPTDHQIGKPFWKKEKISFDSSLAAKNNRGVILEFSLRARKLSDAPNLHSLHWNALR